MTARQQQRPPLAFCVSCNARERAIVAGRCIVCGNPPRRGPIVAGEDYDFHDEMTKALDRLITREAAR